MESLLESNQKGSILRTIYNKLNWYDSRNKNKEKDKNYLNGSISNAANNLILTFPMLCDDSLPPTTASMISKANERNIVTMLQLLFASMNLTGESGQEILNSIHKNIKANYSMDDIIDILDDVAESVDISKAELNAKVKEIMEQMKIPQKSFPVNSFSERSLNEYTVLDVYGKTVVKENPNPYLPTDDNMQVAKYDNLNAQTQKTEDDNARAAQLQPMKVKDAYNKNSEYLANGIQKQLMDQDVKKCNEMQPTLMIVKFNSVVKDDKGEVKEILSDKPFVTGVKSRLISVDSFDIVDRLAVKNKTKVNFLNFIRATTGEIGFFKDFIFCIDQAKIDAKNSVKKGQAAQMWKLLEARSSKNFINKNKRTGNDASAITTLVLSQETVNILKKEYDFDLEKISNTRMILDAYNLLGIFIADESVEVAKYIYAGNDTYEQIAYSFLERESGDNSYKKVINLMSKMNGGR